MNPQFTAMPEKFHLGYPAVDLQHEILFVLFDELTQSIKNIGNNQKDDSFELKEIYMGLNSYVKNHFNYEEEKMHASKYQNSEAHTHEHRQLEQQITDLSNQFTMAADKEEINIIAKNTHAFLYEWLVQHIADSDKKLCDYLIQ
ncbi:MAG: hemerythrin domain-containing protein [Magnetococcus sp. DMHC-6]